MITSALLGRNEHMADNYCETALHCDDTFRNFAVGQRRSSDRVALN